MSPSLDHHRIQERKTRDQRLDSLPVAKIREISLLFHEIHIQGYLSLTFRCETEYRLHPTIGFAVLTPSSQCHSYLAG